MADRNRRVVIAAVLVIGPAAIVIACSGDDVAPASVNVPDAGSDAIATADAFVPPFDAGACVPSTAPRGRTKLSETGLYADIATKTIACDAVAFEPEFKLWSDGAVKKRWVRLPAGATIDTSDPDHWVFPVGTQFFKEFSLDGKRLETRLVEHIANTGTDGQDYWLGAFAWRDDESDADYAEHGGLDVRGTPHDIPPAGDCWTCHVGERGHGLGFSALQLSHDGVLDDLAKRGFFAAPVAAHPLPGTPTERAAVGWLHANCGHCHNEHGIAWHDTQMTLRIGYDEATEIAETKMWKSTVNVRTQSFVTAGITTRIKAGDPDASCVAYRPSIRGADNVQMPPIATEYVDDAGVASVRAWISSIDAGAP